MRRFVQPRSLFKIQGALLLLIVAMGLIFLLQVLLGEGFYGKYMTIPTEVLAEWQNLRDGYFQEIAWIEIFTLFSAALLHGSPEHLIGNMIFLWIFAALAVELLGSRVMLFTFIFTAITGSIVHIALNTDSFIPMLGASGAVMGFEGLYFAMAVRWRLPDPHVWPMSRPIAPGQLAMVGIIGLVFDFMGYTSCGTGVAYGAHFGGFIGGLLLGSFFVKMPRMALPR
ncbi:MAG: rhomboid family intramembrane serine protease [Verrucomicrobiota bacterium]